MNIIYLFRRIPRQLSKKTIPIRIVIVADEPDTIRPNCLYLLGSFRRSWAAILNCPCGCNAVIRLNLLPEVRPRWKVKKHLDSTVSVFPSIDRMFGCKSHFWIRRGIVIWISRRDRYRKGF